MVLSNLRSAASFSAILSELKSIAILKTPEQQNFNSEKHPFLSPMNQGDYKCNLILSIPNTH